jgi:hypothetical protein
MSRIFATVLSAYGKRKDGLCLEVLAAQVLAEGLSKIRLRQKSILVSKHILSLGHWLIA